ncbi:hypothetical protein RND71_034273 [Anisodus tanguticus]|uniref:Uncharacterized protein n=1 Tax=Anisodus tanguticus TaxID=243964 RepID=A0AAE1V413_9SOLA|nr:hypothetical protein RND71_034273 [Anisodus tanguticus]
MSSLFFFTSSGLNSYAARFLQESQNSLTTSHFETINEQPVFRISLQWKDLSIIDKCPNSNVFPANAGTGKYDERFPRLKFLLLKYLAIWYLRANGDHFSCRARLFIKASGTWIPSLMISHN